MNWPSGFLLGSRLVLAPVLVQHLDWGHIVDQAAATDLGMDHEATSKNAQPLSLNHRYCTINNISFLSFFLSTDLRDHRTRTRYG